MWTFRWRSISNCMYISPIKYEIAAITSRPAQQPSSQVPNKLTNNNNIVTKLGKQKTENCEKWLLKFKSD